MKALSIYSRTESRLGKVIEILQESIQNQCSLNKTRQLEKMLCNLQKVKRSMQRLDKKNPEHRSKFWRLSRRSVLLSVKIAREISGA